jgi:hypothetical protein
MGIDPADLVFVVFIAIVIWLALELGDDDLGGGRRRRVPVAM